MKKFFKSAFLFDLFLWDKSNSMSDKEFEKMLDSDRKFAEKVLQMTKEEALAFLVSIGHLDKDGNFTEPYKHLATVVKSI